MSDLISQYNSIADELILKENLLEHYDSENKRFNSMFETLLSIKDKATSSLRGSFDLYKNESCLSDELILLKTLYDSLDVDSNFRIEFNDFISSLSLDDILNDEFNEQLSDLTKKFDSCISDFNNRKLPSLQELNNSILNLKEQSLSIISQIQPPLDYSSIQDTIYFIQEKDGVEKINSFKHDFHPVVILCNDDSESRKYITDSLYFGLVSCTNRAELMDISLVNTITGCSEFTDDDKYATLSRYETSGSLRDLATKLKDVADTVGASGKSIMEFNEDAIKLGNPICKHSIVIFHIPDSGSAVSSSVITDDIRQAIDSKEKLGVLPIFIITENEWENPQIKYIKDLKDNKDNFVLVSDFVDTDKFDLDSSLGFVNLESKLKNLKSINIKFIFEDSRNMQIDSVYWDYILSYFIENDFSKLESVIGDLDICNEFSLDKMFSALYYCLIHKFNLVNDNIKKLDLCDNYVSNLTMARTLDSDFKSKHLEYFNSLYENVSKSVFLDKSDKIRNKLKSYVDEEELLNDNSHKEHCDSLKRIREIDSIIEKDKIDSKNEFYSNRLDYDTARKRLEMCEDVLRFWDRQNKSNVIADSYKTRFYLARCASILLTLITLIALCSVFLSDIKEVWNVEDSYFKWGILCLIIGIVNCVIGIKNPKNPKSWLVTAVCLVGVIIILGWSLLSSISMIGMPLLVTTIVFLITWLVSGSFFKSASSVSMERFKQILVQDFCWVEYKFDFEYLDDSDIEQYNAVYSHIKVVRDKIKDELNEKYVYEPSEYILELLREKESLSGIKKLKESHEWGTCLDLYNSKIADILESFSLDVDIFDFIGNCKKYVNEYDYKGFMNYLENNVGGF